MADSVFYSFILRSFLMQNTRGLFRHYSKYGFFFLCFFLALFTARCLIVCDVKYEVSDDFVMSAIASGAFNGSPSPYIMFSNVLLGKLLVALYMWIPPVNWYLWMQLLINYLSLCAVAYIFLKKLPFFPAIFLTVCVHVFFAGDLFVLIQFTKTASAAILSGSLLFLFGGLEEESPLPCLFGGLLVLAGSMIRFNCILIAGPFVLIYLIWGTRIFLKRHSKTFPWKQYGAGALLIASIFFLHAADTAAYRVNDELWYYKQFSTIRSQIIDYPLPDYAECEQEFSSIGFSENDYAVLSSWSFADSQIYSLDTMKQVLNIVKQHRSHRLSLSNTIREIRERGCIHYPAAVCCILAGLFCIILDPKRLWLPVVNSLIVFFLLAYFLTIGRCIYRIEFGCFLGAALTIFCCCDAECRPLYRLLLSDRLSSYALWMILTALLALLRLPSYASDSSYQTLSDSDYRDYVDSTFYYSWNYDPQKYTKTISRRPIRGAFLAEAAANPDTLYLLDFNTTIQTLYYDYPPFTPLSPGCMSNLIYLGGVTVNHPVIQQALVRFFDSDPIAGLLSSNVRLVSNTTSEQILAFLQEHVDPSAMMHLESTIDGYQIWQYYSAGSD